VLLCKKKLVQTLRHFLSLIFLCLILYSCAQIGSIGGGPKDELPPEYISSRPENFSVNFKSDEIRILFNEFVKLKNPQQQIIFSPPITPKPIISPMGTASKEVRIKLEKDSLQANTTYTINFGQSIEDNNEGNPLPFFKYVFSTGTYLDSLKLEGTVKDVFFKENPEIVSVMLYEKDSLYSDSVVYKKAPTYIAYAQDSTNGFALENMRKGIYKLIALEDKNNNYKFNQGREKIGFVDSFVVLPTEKTYNINLFETKRDFDVKRPKQITNNQLIFGYEGVLDTTDFAINLLSKAPDTLETAITKSRETDTLNYYFRPYFENDSLLFSFTHKGIIDTLTVKTRELPKDSLIVELKPKSKIEFNELVYIRPNLPIVDFDEKNIKLMDADSTEIPFQTRLDRFNNQVEISFEKEEKARYEFNFYPNTITDFFGNTNDTLTLKLNTKEASAYSLLDLTINNLDRFPVIVQLIDEKDKIDKSVILTDTNKHTFEYITPGDYYVKVIYDDNSNGKWDAGDYLKQIQPEEVKFVKIEEPLRANWDVVKTINLP
jgi:uncharacterized protein (DUF2141 family)